VNQTESSDFTTTSGIFELSVVKPAGRGAPSYAPPHESLTALKSAHTARP
jgi:hypothetical protein